MPSSDLNVTVGMSPAPAPEERAYVSDDMLVEAEELEVLLDQLRTLPVPSNTDFWKRTALRASKLESLSEFEAVAVAARRELRVEFTIYPRRAALHRRLNTRRWRFARDGAL